MLPLRIVGTGIVAGCGCGRSAFENALAEGATAPREFLISTGPTPLALPALRAETSLLETFLPRQTTRRADRFSRMALLGACLALEDSGLPRTELGDSTALVIASGYGAAGSILALQDSVITDGDLCSSPIHFANSLHNSAAANLSILLGIRGPNITISQGWHSVPSALLSAHTLLASGRASRVLFGAVEELSELTGLLSAGRGELPGEGAAFLVLETNSGPGRARITDLQYPAPSGGFEGGVLGSDGPDLRDHFGLSPALPAFQLATASHILSGASLRELPGACPQALTLRWDIPGTRSARCRLETV